MHSTYQKNIDTLALSLGDGGGGIFCSSLQLTPAFLRPGGKMQPGCLQHSLGVMDLAAAGAGVPKARPTQQPGGRDGDLCRPLVASEPTTDEMAAGLSSGPSRSQQCPRAPPSRLQGRDTCWVGAPSRASSHLTPSESPGAPHWQSFRYSGKDWWPLRPPTPSHGEGMRV